MALIEAAGAKALFLPAYSPDFNAIEKRWSKVKAHLRAVEARTLPALQEAIGAALAKVSANDARDGFASCGYSIIETALAVCNIEIGHAIGEPRFPSFRIPSKT